MQTNTSSQSLDYLFMTKPVDARARAQFEARAGLRYGLAFGIALLLVGWGVDAVELAFAQAASFLVKFVVALVLIVPIATVAGALAGRAHAFFGRKLLIWAMAGALIGLIAIHIPFEGASLVAAVLDPATRGLTVVPFTSGAQERVAALVAFGAIAGLVVGILQMLGTTWAWDRSTTDNRMTAGAWIALLISLPPAIALGAVFDGAANSQLRGPLYTTSRVIQLALNTPPDMNLQAMDTLTMLDYVATQRWRGQLTPQYSQQLADFDPATLMWSYIDAEFSNGFLWRCQITRNGEILQSCSDLTVTFRDWMSQFLTKGTVQCDNCDVRVDKAASAWQAQQGSGLAPAQIAVTHRTGGVVVVTAQLAKGGQVECRFVGASPTVIHDCVSK